MKQDIQVQRSSIESVGSGKKRDERRFAFQQIEERLGESRRLDGLNETSASLLFSLLLQQSDNILWLCRNNREAEAIAQDLAFFGGSGPNGREIIVLPGFEADPYRGLSPHPEVAELRALSLWKVLNRQPVAVVTTLHSAIFPLPSPDNLLSVCLHLEVGDFFPMDHLLSRLKEAGYIREDPVSEIGEFSHRGGIVDVFSPARTNPVRIEFFGEEIESIREFDPNTQRSIDLIAGCEVVPMREHVLSETDVALWHREAPEHWNEVRFAESLCEKLQFTENGELFNGFEYLIPLVTQNRSSLFDYLGCVDAGLLVVVSEPSAFFRELDELLEQYQQDYQERESAGDLALRPDQLFFTQAELHRSLEVHQPYFVHQLWDEPGDACRFEFQPERHYHSRLPELLEDVEKWIEKGERILFVMSSSGMAERLVDILSEYDIAPFLSEEGFSAVWDHPISVTEGRLSTGFFSPLLNLHVLTQENVFEESQLKPIRKPPRKDFTGTFLSDFRDLREGDYVVHVEHGIGRFRGLKRIGVGEGEKEFVELMYQKDAKLYVPIDRLDLLQKFSGAGDAKPQLDRLGGASWEKTKSRIRKSMRDLADELLKLYASREVAKGHAFSADDEMMRELEEAFEFDETVDQLQAIRDVKQDMMSERPMDRLICGDVGYGKTEVAMRAAFKAVNDGYQVGLLAPTTVLASQHFTTFRERFQGFPVNVEMLSRFRSRVEQKEILQKTSMGMIDVLIGTHRLLSRDVKFSKLGLIVVDEEQRFGVAQKERLKRFKTEVDVLTLSATPIPRTLNMSMVGVRDLSIIETPPKDRLAIQTVVVKFSRNIIRSAIDLELKRQGQVFFVHNSVQTIHSLADLVREVIPEARVAVAHGQMGEKQLEQVMLQFLNYEADVLVCTTIIENGLDIPRANTLIVNRADHFGLSQLYQLRGRVGRSNRRAYAYLIIPSEEILTTDARKRLSAIREFSDLGAGFRIAALDLEIRGTGNLLGAEQHGHINAVGLELYMKLLEQTVREQKGESISEDLKTSIDLRLNIQIPEHYISDPNLRLWLYKRISGLSTPEALDNLKSETLDRFGKYPRPVANLFEYAGLRLRAQHLHILSIDRKGNKVFFKFREDTPVSAEQIVRVVSSNPRVALTPEGAVVVTVEATRPSEVFADLHQLLSELFMLQ